MSRAADRSTKSGRSGTASFASKMETEREENHEVVEEEMDGDFVGVDRLAAMGINSTDVKKLKDGGYFTVSSLLMATKKQLMAVKGLSEAKVLKMLECANKIVNTDFISGTEARERRKNIFRLTTGSSQLDELLGGGIESASITEAFGEFRTGKTQLSHTLCVTAQLPAEMGGASGRVAFIDTENTFRPERIADIAERYELNADDVLDNIIVARAYTSEHQVDLLPLVAAKMSESPFALLIVDSATALFRVDFSGRGELSERQQKLNRFMSQLTKIAEAYNVAVWITNQVMATPDSSAMFTQDPKKPIGGHVMAHASTTRLYLRKGRGEQRICKIFDSPLLGEGEATFEIGKDGVTDAKD